MISEVLTNLGLSPDEAEIYQSLLNNGGQSASELAKSTKVKRTYVYQICQQLIKKGLVSQGKRGRATLFSSLSPDKLLTLASDRQQTAQQTNQTLEAILPTLKSKYALIETKPVVTYYEGVEGIKRVYLDIIKEGKNILLLRSIYDDKRADLDNLTLSQIKKQVDHGIRTRTITPLVKTTRETYLKLDNKRLVERHIVKNFEFKLPAQIIIYGHKVAIISLKKHITTTLIDHKDIHGTFRNLFELIWQATKEEHNKIIKKWPKQRD